jgi:hypothetical protein
MVRRFDILYLLRHRKTNQTHKQEKRVGETNGMNEERRRGEEEKRKRRRRRNTSMQKLEVCVCRRQMRTT